MTLSCLSFLSRSEWLPPHEDGERERRRRRRGVSEAGQPTQQRVKLHCLRGECTSSCTFTEDQIVSAGPGKDYRGVHMCQISSPVQCGGACLRC